MTPQVALVNNCLFVCLVVHVCVCMWCGLPICQMLESSLWCFGTAVIALVFTDTVVATLPNRARTLLGSLDFAETYKVAYNRKC